MTWNRDKAIERIQDLIKSIPSVDTQEFETDSRLQIKSLSNLVPNKAVVVDGVHIYVHLIRYNENILKEDRETEAAQARALEFLHLHYGACDRVIAERNAKRIDFHGPRMHAVVAEPKGKSNARARVIEAMELAQEMMLLSELANKEIGNGKYPASFRIGIDTGLCVAIDSGTRNESEPLFLGSPANHAAKLADGDIPGIFISDNVRRILGMSDSQMATSLDKERLTEIKDINVFKVNSSQFSRAFPIKNANELLSDWKSDITAQKVEGSRFKFHYHRPPLVNIDYEKLFPSNSIRMPVVSIFADIDGYTNYIDTAVRNNRVGEAVKVLYVIRKELQNVIQKDYDGRKVRFIGDCMHGLIASGSETEVDESATVKVAVECAAAIRSSFELCKELLYHANTLGLAIGLELGETPISRIGLRGDRSIRLATSVATITSEEEQSRCSGDETAIGSSAYEAASVNIQNVFGSARIARNFNYSTAIPLLMEVRRASSILGSSTPLRAHCAN